MLDPKTPAEYRLILPENPPSLQTGRPFVQKTSISLESGANLWKVEFGTPFRRFYSVNLRYRQSPLATEGYLSTASQAA